MKTKYKTETIHEHMLEERLEELADERWSVLHMDRLANGNYFVVLRTMIPNGNKEGGS